MDNNMTPDDLQLKLKNINIKMQEINDELKQTADQNQRAVLLADLESLRKQKVDLETTSFAKKIMKHSFFKD